MASLEAGRDWTLWGADSRLSFGLQYDSREATGSPGPIAFPVPLDYAQYVTDEPWDTDFERGVQGTYVDNVGLREELERTLEEQGLTVPLDPTLAYEVTEDAVIFVLLVLGVFETQDACDLFSEWVERVVI